jgi:hypothetical protein
MLSLNSEPLVDFDQIIDLLNHLNYHKDWYYESDIYINRLITDSYGIQLLTNM